jgi:hypothetical protein
MVQTHDLTQAMSPMLNLILQILFFQKKFENVEYLTNILITFGVILASFTDIEFNLLQFTLFFIECILNGKLINFNPSSSNVDN